MKLAKPNLPSGPGNAAFFMRCVWFMLFGGAFPIKGVSSARADVKVEFREGNYEITVNPKASSASDGWHFEDKIEVDNTKSYPKQTVIHIQDTHSLVTAGIRDAADPDGGLVTACAGFWVSTQAVPAKTTVDGNDVWNLPQYPYPEPTDMDDPANFWIYLGEVIAC